jgi:hypothetical protein
MLLQHADYADDDNRNGSTGTAVTAKVSPRRGAAAANGAVRRVAFSIGGADAQKTADKTAAGEDCGGDNAGVQDTSIKQKGSVAAAAKFWGQAVLPQ